jgi:hypothetical protein
LETNRALHRYPGDGCFRFYRHLHGFEGRLVPTRGVRFDCFPRRFANNLHRFILGHGVLAGSALALLVWELQISGLFFFLWSWGFDDQRKSKEESIPGHIEWLSFLLLLHTCFLSPSSIREAWLWGYQRRGLVYCTGVWNCMLLLFTTFGIYHWGIPGVCCFWAVFGKDMNWARTC